MEKNMKKNVYICITESLCHVAEINTTLTWHQSLFNKKFKKHIIKKNTTYYKATVIKKVWCQHKDRQAEYWHRIESPEINPCVHSHRMFTKESRPQGKKSLFNKWCWGNWIFICKIVKLGPYLIPYKKINSKSLKI